MFIVRDLRAAERGEARGRVQGRDRAALSDGFTDDEVKAAKAGWLQAQQVTRAQDGLAGRTAEHAASSTGRLPGTASWNRMVALTPADIQRRSPAHRPGEDPFVKAGDFAKAAAAAK